MNTLIINFGHVFTDQQIAALRKTLGDFRLIERKFHLDAEKPFAPQVKAIIDSLQLSAEDWKTRIVLNPPGLSAAAVLTVAEVAARAGRVPKVIRMKAVNSAGATVYALAEIISVNGEDAATKPDADKVIPSEIVYPDGVKTLDQQQVLKYTSTNGRSVYQIVLKPGVGMAGSHPITLAYGKAKRLDGVVIVEPAVDYDVIIVAGEYAGNNEVMAGEVDKLLSVGLQSSKYLSVLAAREGAVIKFYGYKERSCEYVELRDGRLVEPDPVYLAELKQKARRRQIMDTLTKGPFLNIKNNPARVYLRNWGDGWQAVDWNTGETICRFTSPEEAMSFIEATGLFEHWYIS